MQKRANYMSHLSLEAELYFQELEAEKDAALAAEQTITNTLDRALKAQDTDLLLTLIPYIETGEGHLAYKYRGEIHRILRMLHIIELEQKYQKELFSSGCTCKDSLWEKYMLALFAFRRLLFQLSDTSVEEAASYLQRADLSVFAVYVILKDDLIVPDDSLYEQIISICSNHWDSGDIRLLLTLVQSEETATADSSRNDSLSRTGNTPISK